MTHKPTEQRAHNRTGMKAAPQAGCDTVESAKAGTTDAVPDVGELARVRIDLSREVDPVGTLPMPAGNGENRNQATAVFMDLLGERLAFERTGVRLYDALLCKHAAAHLHDGAPRAQDLTHIRDEELKHYALLEGVMERIGGDPTAVTPSADVMGTATRGLMQVLSDPRTTFTQGLKAILAAELTDQGGWEALVAVTESLGEMELGRAFRAALVEEEEHVRNMKRWLSVSLQGQAT